MSSDTKILQIDSVLTQIKNLKNSDFDNTLLQPLKGDELDAIIIELNALTEILRAKEIEMESNKKRMNDLLDVLLKYTTMDFSQKASISEKGDELDALAAGINALVEELEFKMNELKQKGTELARSNAELEQFGYVASHDLQEPLRMVSSYLQLLEKRYKDKLDEDANEFINYAVDGSNRMRILINSLLEYSRINRVKPFEKIYMNELFEEVLQNLKDQITDSGAIVTADPLPDIFGDSVLISQLIQNLISNAIKFRGDKTPKIKVSGNKLDGQYLFSIKDNGIGIKKEYADKIFVIFQRLHTKEEYPGTGIGLALCKKIVERHNGKIWMESEPNSGSTFYFTIKTK